MLAGIHFSEFDKTDSLFPELSLQENGPRLMEIMFCFSTRGSSYELFTMAPSRIERIDNTRGAKQFESRLHPADIKLVDAMATSAAVVSYRMGEYTLQQLQNLQIMLGIGMGQLLKLNPDVGDAFQGYVTVYTGKHNSLNVISIVSQLNK